MKEELTIIKPEEYGLDASKTKSIEEAFTPKVIERNALTIIYDTLITKELTTDLSIEARDLRLQLVKVRTGISSIHKTQKAFFLAAGKFCDAWKHKETLPVVQMEEKLTEIEKFAEIEEAKKLKELTDKRIGMMLLYLDSPELANLGEMPEPVFNAYFESCKTQYNERIEKEKEDERLRIEAEKAEAKRIKDLAIENKRLKKEVEENERIENEKVIKAKKRSDELRPYLVLIRDYQKIFDSNDADYTKHLNDLKVAAKLEAEHQEKERQKEEQKRIEDEKIQREKQYKIDKRNVELKPYLSFIEDYQKVLMLSDEVYNMQISTYKKKLKQKQDEDAKEEQKRIETKMLADELVKKQANELEIKQQKEAEEKEKALAPDKDRLIQLGKDILSIELPALQSTEAINVLNEVKTLLGKINNHITDKVKLL